MIACMVWMTGKTQVSINTDDSSPLPSAMLDVKSSTKGILPPRMTDVQINAIASPEAGLTVYCTDCNSGVGCLKVYYAGSWHCLGPQPAVVVSSCGNSFFYYTVSAAGYTWLDRNLGASRVAQTSNDYLAYGSLYQWGRQSDGHQCINWTSSTTGTPQNGTTPTLCSNGTCPNALFVANLACCEWNAPSSNILWNGSAKGANDPCPAGYRVPSQAEFQALDNSFSPNDPVGALASPVRMPMPGYRDGNAGSILSAGSVGYYYSSTYSDGGGSSTYAWYLAFFSGNSSMSFGERRNGYAVRCIVQ